MSTALGTKTVPLWTLGASVGLVTTAAVVWVLTGSEETNPDAGDQPAVDESAPFSITGDLAESLRPGASVPLDLRISNPHDTALVITELRVTIENVHAPHASSALPCSIDDFTVEQSPADFEATVDAAASSTLGELGIPAIDWPLIGMLDSSFNQDGCKGAVVTLAYTATGRGES